MTVFGDEILKIAPDDPNYPNEVRERLKKPPELYCKGNPNFLKAEKVAIVGSRHATDKGLYIASRMATALAKRGVTIVSGYAKGVDEMAHLGALLLGGVTIAVLSYGIDKFYVRKEIRQVHDWEKNLVIISQFEPNAVWKPWRAMRRNELVVALSHAVVVIASGEEVDASGKKSGTFNAAKRALEMNVPLYVVDPDLLGDNFTGNERLIKMGGIKILPSSTENTNAAADEIVKNLHRRPDTSTVYSEQLKLF